MYFWDYVLDIEYSPLNTDINLPNAFMKKTSFYEVSNTNSILNKDEDNIKPNTKLLDRLKTAKKLKLKTTGKDGLFSTIIKQAIKTVQEREDIQNVVPKVHISDSQISML